MTKVLALAAAVLCTAICVAPSYARRGVHGTLAVRLQVDHGGPRNRQFVPFTIRLRLVVRSTEGVTILSSEKYAKSGHVSTLGLPNGRYTVSAAELPPVVNPTERGCKSAPSPIRVQVGRTVHTSVTCVLIG
jgi:hypothetical protein